MRTKSSHIEMICIMLMMVDFIRVSYGLESPVVQKPLMIPPDLRLGERADIICTLRRGSPPVDFLWYFNGRQIKGEEFGKVTSYDQRSSVYLIEHIRAENVGNYTCTVTNSAGSDSAAGQLLVEVPPVWEKEPTDVDVVSGSQVVLTCSATAHPSPRITWTKLQEHSTSDTENGFMYPRGESQNSAPSWNVASNGSLIIAQADESATYVCKVDNGIGPGLTKNIKLRVHVPPKVFVQSTPVSIRKGETAKLLCDVTGDGPINVTWVKKNVPIEVRPGSRFESNLKSKPSKDTGGATNSNSANGKLQTFELVVRDSQPTDVGAYTCLASNNYGSDRLDISLNVLEPSASPRGVRITDITSRSARVSWQPPLPSNSPVLKYHVRYWKSGDVSGKQLHQSVLTGSETSTYLEALHPGTTYNVQVLAENKVGLSEPSQVRQVQMKEEAPSGAPTDVHVLPVGSKSIEVTWKPPPSETWNGQLKGYYLGYKVSTSPLAYVYHTASDSATTQSFGSATNTSRRFRVKGLLKSTTYAVVVKAYNSVGSGPETQPVEVRTRESDPPYPPSFVVTDVTSSSALVQIKSEDLSPVLQYIVEYRRPNQEWHSIHIPRDKSSFLLTRLDNSMTYEVRLAAYNEHGRGEFSSSLAFTTTERETNIGFRSAEEDVPFYFQHYFVMPVAASIVVIVTTIVFAWVCYKRVVFRQHRHLVLQQQIAGHIADAQMAVHRDGYVRPPTYSPPTGRHVVVAATNNTTSTTATSACGNTEDGYDAPWDVRKPPGASDVRY